VESHELCPSMTTTELLLGLEIPTNNVVANDTALSPSVTIADLLPGSKLPTDNVVGDDIELSPLVTTMVDLILSFATDPWKVVLS
jgi:hypothetical protein